MDGMTGGGRTQVRFPGTTFFSAAEFEAWCRDVASRLDARYLHERSLASSDSELRRPGTCAPCLRATTFRSRTETGEVMPTGARVPSWREEQVCGCPSRLGGRARALLHFVQASGGLMPWSRLLLFGPPAGTDTRLAALAGETVAVPRLSTAQPGPPRIDAPDASADLAVSAEALHRIPPIGEALTELRRVLAPGGQLILTVPLRYRSSETVSRVSHLPRLGGRLPAEFGAEIHEFGWDILDALRGAGFVQASAHTWWSDELGYLGPFNFLIRAVA